jgi:hypothetical protein
VVYDKATGLTGRLPEILFSRYCSIWMLPSINVLAARSSRRLFGVVT